MSFEGTKSSILKGNKGLYYNAYIAFALLKMLQFSYILSTLIVFTFSLETYFSWLLKCMKIFYFRNNAFTFDFNQQSSEKITFYEEEHQEHKLYSDLPHHLFGRLLDLTATRFFLVSTNTRLLL